MPNHVRNVVKISKIKPEEINIVLDMITTTLDDPTFPDKQYMIDFDKIIPEPKEESECPDEYKVNKESRIEVLKDRPWFDWYKWHINHWGTKWDAYDCYTNVGKTYIQFVFSTAWATPVPIFHRLAVLGYQIDIKYADEDYGVNCGRMKYINEQGWTHQNSLDMKDPVRFAREVWKY